MELKKESGRGKREGSEGNTREVRPARKQNREMEMGGVRQRKNGKTTKG